MNKEQAIDVLNMVETHGSLPTKAKEMAIKALENERPKGEWLRMSNLSEQEDDRYKCSHCGNVVHYKDKMNLYTFNCWCGRCGSDNRRKIEKEKFGKDNKVPTKKTNFEKIKNMSSKEFAEKYARYMCDIGYCEVEGENACPCYELCAITPCNEFNGCEDVFKKWLESEVENE